MPAADIRNAPRRRMGCFKIIWKHIHSAPSSAYPYISRRHRQFYNNKSYKNVYFIVSTGCGTADEHTEHSAVAEWDAAFRSVHRAFC